MHPETILAQAGSHADSATGSLSAPIHQAATFSHPALGQSTGYDYSRTANPTRTILEQTLAHMDHGAKACAFASGMAALDAVLRLVLASGKKHIIMTEDPYGGTLRLMEQFFRPNGAIPLYVDTTDADAVHNALDKANGDAAAVIAEIPTNPLMRVADIDQLAQTAHAAGAMLVIDNTFLTPYLFRPLDHGADIAVYSATKYLGGHNDVVAGSVVCKDETTGAELARIQNATGAILGPMDSWLLIRGLKTLAVRLDRQQENALAVARFLDSHPRVTAVHFPGLESHPGHERMRQQANGFGAMLSFEVDAPALVPAILSGTKVFFFAESLGGVESLITFPATQTHAEIPAEIRERLGITNRLLRVSVGIENVTDLIEDLKQALSM